MNENIVLLSANFYVFYYTSYNKNRVYKIEVVLDKKWIDTPLIASDLKVLAQELNLYDINGRLKGNRAVKSFLSENGYDLLNIGRLKRNHDNQVSKRSTTYKIVKK